MPRFDCPLPSLPRGVVGVVFIAPVVAIGVGVVGVVVVGGVVEDVIVVSQLTLLSSNRILRRGWICLSARTGQTSNAIARRCLEWNRRNDGEDARSSKEVVGERQKMTGRGVQRK